ncbi:hypothetical protein AAMO2058_001721400 [Amorphochlora amoebiformis]
MSAPTATCVGEGWSMSHGCPIEIIPRLCEVILPHRYPSIDSFYVAVCPAVVRTIQLFVSASGMATCLFLVAALASLPSIAGVKKISMTQGQFCKSCCATVEAIFEYAEEQAKETHKLDLVGSTVAEQMCKQPPFTYYKNFFQIGCEQIVLANLTKLVQPLMNKGVQENVDDDEGRKTTGDGISTVFKSDTLKFDHIKTFCGEIGACPDTFFKMGRETIRDKCKACQEFVWDFKVVLAREKEVTPKRVFEVLVSLCEKLALLHLRPGRIEDTCEEFVEVWYERYLDEGDDEKFLHIVADHIQDIMVGKYDITSPICTQYTKACGSGKKNKKKRKKRRTRKEEL